MFHQVGVCEEDRDSLRFLWRDLDEMRRPNEYKMTVHVFGAVDSPCCPNYALQRAARDQQGKFSEDAINAVRRNLYIDDLLASKQNSDKATGLSQIFDRNPSNWWLPPNEVDVRQPRSAFSDPLF